MWAIVVAIVSINSYDTSVKIEMGNSFRSETKCLQAIGLIKDAYTGSNPIYGQDYYGIEYKSNNMIQHISCQRI